MDRRPTQNDVAAKAGVHPSTVSLALKNHRSIPEATRQKIRRAAMEIGYFPDPMLGALASYRARLKPCGFQGALAWLTNNLGKFRWNANASFQKYFEGARRRAEACGFRLREFDLQTPGMTPERMRSVLHSQNIQGILLCPQPLPQMEFSFSWDEFAAVTFGHTLLSPKLHRVACAHYDSMLEAMQRLGELGYRRVGFFLRKSHVKRVNYSYLAGYLTGVSVGGRFATIPPFYRDEGSPEEFEKWLRKHRCDALVCADHDIVDLLARLGFRVPQDIGVCNFLIHSPDGPMSGIYEEPLHMGDVAASLVVRLVQQGERGIPQVPQNIYIQGIWVRGNTVRERA